MTAPSRNVERALIGSVLLSHPVAERVLDHGVRPEHFADEPSRLIWEAVTALVDDGHHITVLAVSEQLRSVGMLDAAGGMPAIDALTAESVAVTSLRQVADQVKGYHQWRQRQGVVVQLDAACSSRDEDAYRAAEQHLGDQDATDDRKRTLSPMEVGDAFIRSMSAGTVERFPWPYRRLNELSRGGARRGQVTVIAGPISHGKSALVDGVLESMSKGGRSVHLYMNEMLPDERAGRVAARRSGVSMTRIDLAANGERPLDQREAQKVVAALADQPIGMTACDGWDATRICRHARRNRYDIIAVDGLNRLPFKGGESRRLELDAAISAFDQLAKGSRCHVIVVCHLNRQRASATGRYDAPSLTDLKESAALAEVPDNVLFVWREQDADTKDPTEEGWIRFAKCRGGKLGGTKVRFDGEHQEFIPTLQVAA